MKFLIDNVLFFAGVAVGAVVVASSNAALTWVRAKRAATIAKVQSKL
jgi:hypothetical protein